jgi:hypothetical protein
MQSRCNQEAIIDTHQHWLAVGSARDRRMPTPRGSCRASAATGHNWCQPSKGPDEGGTQGHSSEALIRGTSEAITRATHQSYSSEAIRGDQTQSQEPIRGTHQRHSEAFKFHRPPSISILGKRRRATDLLTLRVIAPRSIGAEREAKGVCLGRLSPAVGLLQHEAAL